LLQGVGSAHVAGPPVAGESDLKLDFAAPVHQAGFWAFPAARRKRFEVVRRG
jgi:hypothetical protein